MTDNIFESLITRSLTHTHTHTHTHTLILSWFSVHCTSMNNTNRLISGDNKGHASFLMEQKMNGAGTLPGQVGGKETDV